MPINDSTEWLRVHNHIRKESTTPKWHLAVKPIGFRDVADTLKEDGVVYADMSVQSGGLQYFEVSVNKLRGVRLGVGIFQIKARAKGPPHLNIKNSKIWWTNGVLQSCKTVYGTRDFQGVDKRCSPGDIMGCGALLEQRSIFFTKNGAWIGDYALDARLETRLAVFLCPDVFHESSSSPWLDLRISFDESHAPFAAQPYLSRLVAAGTRHSVGHAPLPPEVLSTIISYITLGATRKAQILVPRIRLVCRHWGKIIQPLLYADIAIPNVRRIYLLMQAIRNFPANTTSPGTYIHKISLGIFEQSEETVNPALETILILGLGAHAIHLTQLTGSWYGSYYAKAFPPAPPQVSSRLPALLRHLRALHTLDLEHRSLDSCAQLLSVIHALPSLKDLKLKEVTVDRVGPVRTQHVTAAVQRLQTFFWRARTTVNEQAAMAAVAARLCTSNSSDASAMAEAVTKAPWITHRSNSWPVAEYSYKANTGGRPNSYLTLSRYNEENLILKWRIPPSEENSPTRARLLATLDSAGISPTVELALKDIDPNLRPHYPLTLTLKGPDPESEVNDIQARLSEIMPHAHRLGLISIQVASRNQK